MPDRPTALREATRLLAELLEAGEPAELEAIRSRCGGASTDDVARARRLLTHLVAALEGGDARAWDALMRACDMLDAACATEPETAPATVVMPPEPDIDRTLPAGTSPVVDIDETLVVGEMRALTDQELEAQPATTDMAASDQPQSASQILDLEKYAVLCAWCQEQPERRQALNRQYGLADEAERAELDHNFEELFQQDLQLRNEFSQRRSTHLAWIRKLRSE